jgi:hypothetical protein
MLGSAVGRGCRRADAARCSGFVGQEASALAADGKRAQSSVAGDADHKGTLHYPPVRVFEAGRRASD